MISSFCPSPSSGRTLPQIGGRNGSQVNRNDYTRGYSETPPGGNDTPGGSTDDPGGVDGAAADGANTDNDEADPSDPTPDPITEEEEDSPGPPAARPNQRGKSADPRTDGKGAGQVTERGLGSPNGQLYNEQTGKRGADYDVPPTVGEMVLAGGYVVGSFVPGVGELQDINVLTDPNSTTLDKTVAAGSIGLSAISLGVMPNAGGVIKAGKSLGGSSATAKTGINTPTIGGRRPVNSGYAGQLHPSGVGFNSKGFPDFKPVSRAQVELNNLTGVSQIDNRLANQAAGFGSSSKAPTGYTWYHVEDGVTMQLVPTDIHRSTPHTGGAAVIRNGGFD